MECFLLQEVFQPDRFPRWFCRWTTVHNFHEPVIVTTFDPSFVTKNHEMVIHENSVTDTETWSGKRRHKGWRKFYSWLEGAFLSIKFIKRRIASFHLDGFFIFKFDRISLKISFEISIEDESSFLSIIYLIFVSFFHFLFSFLWRYISWKINLKRSGFN